MSNSTYISSCYNCPARLLITGGAKIKSLEGITQGDPTAMTALSVIPLRSYLLQESKSKCYTAKEVAFANDFTVAGKMKEIRSFWNTLVTFGPKHSYYPKPSKYYLILKDEHSVKANEVPYVD